LLRWVWRAAKGSKPRCADATNCSHCNRLGNFGANLATTFDFTATTPAL
jgi:hypothetical protein